MNELENFYITNKKNVEFALLKVRDEKYVIKNISKKNGKTRILHIPPSYTKIIQKKFSQILQKQYIPLKPIHGFVKIENNTSRNIITNASNHINKRYVINIDIENFFDTINFGRVRGLFMSNPFNINESIATKLAQLVTYENKLPQGSPTSPIISNLICRKLDHQLIKIAKDYSLTYTRYADDITFSTYNKKINYIRIIRDIDKIIKNNGFIINKSKTRIQKFNQTQIVTGLKVNQKINVSRKYIKQIRSMLFSWYKNGLENASNLHFDKFNKQESKYILDRNESFKNILIGKINFLGQVKGKEDRLFIKFTHTYYLLRDEYFLKEKQNKFEILDINNLKYCEIIKIFTQIYDTKLVLTEGITDIIYIKQALKYFKNNNKFKNLKLRFCQVGSISNLIEIYKVLFENPKDLTVINRKKCLLPYIDKKLNMCFVMDSDDKQIELLKKTLHFHNYYLLAEDIGGYIEKLFNKNLIIEIINKNGYVIDTSNPKLQDSSKKGLEEYLRSTKKSDNEFHAVPKTSYIAYENKILKKTELSKFIIDSENVNYDRFENLFNYLENIKIIDFKYDKLCSNSIF
ncbi:reverse transcriptase domain-containing protein [Arcobacter sp. CECT 9188]|uniref:reverse transcriptase domain-containing protein n=1 Tax=Arcobacter sp. CECT 9188 TaxID=2044505 RepID=UPI000DEBF797|nr:reverse transcriptase domain-containing protein [Arcobacter sp. CECT 9188]RBQ27059.1 hypothetical protein CRU88_04790 [Arcobacter sp. CECT 9188]